VRKEFADIGSASPEENTDPSSALLEGPTAPYSFSTTEQERLLNPPGEEGDSLPDVGRESGMETE
jgi:hypothetical protein